MTDELNTTPPPPPGEPPSGDAPPPPPSTPPPADSGGSSSNQTLMLVLSYLGPLALIPFFTAQDDKEVHWHSKNGLVLFVAEVALWFLFFIFSMFASGVLGCLGCFLPAIASLVLFGVHVWCIVSALNGKRPIIPGLSQFADNF